MLFRSRRALFRTARKAKRACWEKFLQTGREEDIWKAISGKQAYTPSLPGDTLTTTAAGKADLLAATSFPMDRTLIRPRASDSQRTLSLSNRGPTRT